MRSASRSAALLVLGFVAIWGLASVAPAPAAPAPKEAEARGVFVLDDCDPVFKGKAAYEDSLSYYDAAGKLVFRVSGFNNAQSVGAQHRVAVDHARGWVWVCEDAGRRVRKLDRAGKGLVDIPNVRAHALAVDPATGNAWILTTEGTIFGHRTVVYAPDGTELVTHTVSGHDIVYDPAAKAFWLAGKDLHRVPADRVKTPVGPGDIPTSENVSPFCVASLAVDPRAHRVWASSRRAVDRQLDELVEVGPDARVRARVTLELGGDRLGVPYHLSADARADKVWVTYWKQAVYRYGPDRKPDLRLDLKSLACAADEGTGGAWVTTDDEVLRVDAKGEVVRRASHAKPARTAWVALD